MSAGERGRSDQLVVRLPREEIVELRRLAEARGYRLSELVRLALRRVLRGTVKVAPKRTEEAVQPRATA